MTSAVKKLKVTTPNVKDLEALFRLEEEDVGVILDSLLNCDISPKELKKVTEKSQARRW